MYTNEECWAGFKFASWTKNVNLRSFIKHNYTPYDGNEDFLAKPTKDTLDLWEQVLELSKKEREMGGVLDMDTEIKCNGVYSYRIADPITFYTKIAANVASDFRREEIDNQLKTEFIDALSPAFAALSEIGLRPAQIPAHNKELRDNANEALRELWFDARGIEIVSIALNPVSISEEDAAMIKQYQRGAAAGRDPGMAGGVYLESQGQGIREAGKNPNGAVGGFMGVGMGMNMGGAANTVNNLFEMGQQQRAQQAQQAQAAPPAQQAAPAAGGWTCECGAQNTGKFCTNCGKPAPQPAANDSWFCGECGTKNTGKFCTNCGKPRG